MEEMKEENEYRRVMMIQKISHQNLKFQDPILTVLRVTAPLSQNRAHRGGSAVYGVALGSLDCWDSGFESHCGHGCSSVVFVVLCEWQHQGRAHYSSRGVLPRACVCV